GASGVKNLASRTRSADGAHARERATSSITHSSNMTPGTMGLPGKCPWNTGCSRGRHQVFNSSAMTDRRHDAGHARASLADERQRVAEAVVREAPQADREFHGEHAADE